MIRPSALLLLLLPLTVSGQDGFYSNSQTSMLVEPSATETATTATTAPANGATATTPAAGETRDGVYQNTNSINSIQYGQQDALLSTLGDSATTLMTLMFGQCLAGIDMDELQNKPFKAVDNICTPEEEQKFTAAMNEFNACADFNLHDLIETFGSVAVGMVLSCGGYVSDTMDLVENISMVDVAKLMGQESPIPRVPAHCVQALAGDNPFARAFMEMEEYPEKEMKCFAILADKLPKCTISEWPVPIVGTWLKIMSCIYGSMDEVMKPMVDEQCQTELKSLSGCLPAEVNEGNCKDTLIQCIFTSVEPPMSMVLPPPFWGPPMDERCKKSAGTTYASVLERYETYRNVCIPADDRAIWDLSSDSAVKKTAEAIASPVSNMINEANDESKASKRSSSSSSSKFMPGLFTGLIVAFAGMFGLQKYRTGHVDVRSSFGFSYDSLELSESPPRGFA